MVDKIGKGILIAILTIGVLVGAYLGYTRYFVELQERTVELCVDLNDVKRMAAIDKKPLGPILDEIRKRGIVSVGVFEETLPDANALGEIYYTKGSGVMRIKLNPLYCTLGKKGKIRLPRTYIYAPHDDARRRIYSQLSMVLGKGKIKFYDKDKLEVDEAEAELREVGLGISELQKNFLYKKGFRIIPRVWNDERYHMGNISAKIDALGEFDTIIFDGEEIIGYPDALKTTADALKMNKIRYGYIEIVKQDGDKKLRRLMDRNMIRVHSVPKQELKKITVERAIKRFVRAARERKVKLIYLRPFLPPQVVGNVAAFNLDYFSAIRQELEQGGFVLGKAELTYPLDIKGWQIFILGLAVFIAAAFLFNYFIRVPIVITFLGLILLGCALVVLGSLGYGLLLQKGLALLAAITFPSLAVISTFSVAKKTEFSVWNTILMVLNIIAETLIGIFLVMGLLADYRFTLGIEAFSGVKIALILPILIVALYFILQQGEGKIKDRVRGFLNIDVKLAAVFSGLFILGALGIFVARSGNFVLPVPGFERVIRGFLESLFFIRPRTKEFMIGYPFLFLAATFLLRGKYKWLWILAAIGTIAPISVFNTFCHIHTPVIVSMVRTINGLTLGIIIGVIVAWLADKLIKK
jgi:hypothetical protein